MGMDAELQTAIDEIPGDEGWWKNSSREDYMELAERLLDAGLEGDEIVEILSKAYFAAVACCGG